MRLSPIGDAYAVALDVSSEESVEAAATWFFDTFDHLDMLVNNAGIGSNAPGMDELPKDHHFFDIPVSTVDAVIRTNFLGLFNVTSKFAPKMAERGSGTTLYTSTSTETMTRPGQLPYGPSKAGAEAMVKIMADEIAEFGVSVNIICPGGFTDTGMAGKGAKEFFEKNNVAILAPTVMNKLILFSPPTRRRASPERSSSVEPSTSGSKSTASSSRDNVHMMCPERRPTHRDWAC